MRRLVLARIGGAAAVGGEQPVRAGESVLVQGTGGVSLFALQIARMAGARVIATTSSDEKAERLRELGAETVIDYRTDAEWDEAVLAATSRRGVDRRSRWAAPAPCRGRSSPRGSAGGSR